MNTRRLDCLAEKIACRIKHMRDTTISSAISKMSKEQGDAYYKKFDAKVTPREKAFKEKMVDYFSAQRDQVKANLKKIKSGSRFVRKVDKRDIDNIVFGSAEWKRKYQEMLESEYEETIITGGDAALTQVGSGLSFDLANEDVQNYVGNRLDRIPDLVNQTTEDALKEMLQEGIANGESIPDLAQRIELVFEDAIGHRAEVIARTETISAYSEATIAGYAQSGVVDGVEWIATRDDRTRDSHAALDGKTVNLGEQFEFPDGTKTDGPGLSGEPAFDINCRCALAPVVKD